MGRETELARGETGSIQACSGECEDGWLEEQAVTVVDWRCIACGQTAATGSENSRPSDTLHFPDCPFLRDR